MLFRITRGKAFTHFGNDFLQDKVYKCVYFFSYTVRKYCEHNYLDKYSKLVDRNHKIS